MNKTVRMLGTHGVPANYGGFETAAENIALFLARNGWRVIVYCQDHGDAPLREDVWHGIERVTISVNLPGWKGTSKFDWHCIQHALQFPDLCLTFGYNTAFFSALLRVKGIPNVINMDGIEWSRARWGPVKQAILYVNERIGCLVGNHLIADHPEIEKYLLTRAAPRKITTLTYGADPVTNAPAALVEKLGLKPGNYLNLIARPIPENSVLEMVQGFSSKTRGCKLVILGKYEPETDNYHKQVMAAASAEVAFLGAIYDKAVVQALRFHSRAYVHGHTVGGTNPSLVESLAAGNAVIAHDNPYNRWVAQDAAVYFQDAVSFSACVDTMLSATAQVAAMRVFARHRFAEEFTWDRVAGQYERLLMLHLPGKQGHTSQPVRLPDRTDFVFKIEGQSSTPAGLVIFGWAFARSERLQHIDMERRQDVLQAEDVTGKWHIPRKDIGAAHANLPQAKESGFCVFVNAAAAERSDDLCLVFRLASGAAHRVPLQASLKAGQHKPDQASRSRRSSMGYAASTVWRRLKERKFRAIAVGIASKFSRRPQSARDPIDKVATALAQGGLKGCALIVDHDVGGGANAYRERIVQRRLTLGQASALVTFHQLTSSCSIELVTPAGRDKWALADLGSLLHLANRGLVQELVYNTAVTFPNPVHIPTLLQLMREMSGATTQVLIHDFFAICPSHYLLDANGKFCDIPDIAACRTCLANHTDPYVLQHASRDIDAWRTAWGAFLEVADQITCFSGNSRHYLLKAYPLLAPAKVSVRPHVVDYLGKQQARLSQQGPLRIGIVGKIGHSKGAEVVRGLATEIKRRGLDARIVVAGSLEVATPGRMVCETGPYQRDDFVQIIEQCGANVFLFPSIWPETFSYVAEELMQLQVPLMCFNLGAPAERVRHYARGRVIDYEGVSPLLDALIEFHMQLMPVQHMPAGSGGTIKKGIQ